MTALVSDTSVLIDLERSSLHDVVFTTGLSLAVPDLLYDRELRDYGGPDWLTMGLQVLSLSDQSTADAQSLAHTNRAVSVVDCSALVLAEHHGWTLLSGDRALRQLAEQRGIDCHGFLWVTDQLEGANVDAERLAQAIETIMNHRSCRLPRKECTLRIERLRAKR
jgi:hypothetical protein